MSNFRKLISLFFLFTTSTHAKEELIWVTQDFAPFYISEAPNENKGVADEIITILQNEMPGYEHKREFIPTKRIIKKLKSGEHIVCISFLKDSSVENIAYYSNATMILPPHAIVLRSNDLSKLNKSMTLSEMEKLGFRLLVSDGRHFSEEISNQMKALNSNSEYFRVGDHFHGIAKMIVANRADYTIAYPFELNYLKSSHPILKDLSELNVTGNDKFIPAYAVTPKNEFGKKVITDLNNALSKVRGMKSYKDAHIRWISDSKYFEREFNDFSNKKYD